MEMMDTEGRNDEEQDEDIDFDLKSAISSKKTILRDEGMSMFR